MCICQNLDQGFRLDSASICKRCENGCKQCSVNAATCTGSECRAGYTDFPLCICPVENGFRENIFVLPGEPRTCEPCTAGPGCHQCLIDRNICSGCRKNFELSFNTCLCPLDRGFTLNRQKQPESCECEEQNRSISYETLPPTCVPCHSSCSTCEGPLHSQCRSCTLGRVLSSIPVGSCPVKLNFELKQILKGEKSTLQDIVVSIDLFQEDSTERVSSLTDYNIIDPEIFQILPRTNIKSVEFRADVSA